MSAIDPKDETYIAESKSELQVSNAGNKEPVADIKSLPLPSQIGRFRVQSVLGRGGFGVVYLARDEELSRLVAVKVPHRKIIETDSAAWLEEARLVAALDHDNIVPVYDVGRSEDGDLFMVSKYIEGMTLGEQLRRENLSYRQISNFVFTMANALHFAHQQGVIHRDVKPANILIDKDRRPFLVDFGLALREGRIEKAGLNAGTPSYMSPEQARGEGHRVDGRSDVFSLGVVFYRMLTGTKPFTGAEVLDILHQVEFHTPARPQSVVESVPPELERICMRALEKRASLRFQTASDMAADLQYFLEKQDSQAVRPAEGDASVADPLSKVSSKYGSTAAVGANTTIAIPDKPKVIPRGLRSFEENDAEFFRDLLPGPYDRDGMPDSIRFWKTRLEESDPVKTFSVGLMYGPSGCGKSSLVKAGLLPILDEKLVPIYVEASSDDTETNLLRALKEEFLAIPSSDTLREVFSGLRRGLYQSSSDSVVIVIDQFEQWLSDPRKLAECELVQALRQCDGDYVRCVLMVRDDFWMSATRLMSELEVKIVEGWNSAAVDLFDTAHAKKVLHSFGAAYGRISELESELSSDNKLFLEESVNSLSNDGLVISVQLTVFAEMMKHREWTPSSLKDIGGAQGLGVAFLEDTFNGRSAPPERRLHQNAARSVLQALLPAAGSDLKGHRRSESDLMNHCGYANNRKGFEELIGILDSSLRLISPVDDPEQNSKAETEAEERYYQLSHDYLVGSLRDWLNQKQQETLRGRAQLVLAERSEMWAARKEVKQLPSMLEWTRILFWTRDHEHTDREKQVMKAASRRHGRSLVTALLLLLLCASGIAYAKTTFDRRQERLLVTEKVASLVAADIEQVPNLLDEIREMPGDIQSELNSVLLVQEESSPGRIYASLALLPTDRTQQEYLLERVDDVEPAEVKLISERFLLDEFLPSERLWKEVDSEAKLSDEKLRVLGMLAQTDPASTRWKTTGQFIAQQIVGEPTLQAVSWAQLFRPVSAVLSQPLIGIFQDETRALDERTNAVIVLADQNKDDPEFLADLILQTNALQFAIVLQHIKNLDDACVPLLKQVIAEPIGAGWEEIDLSRFPATTDDDSQTIQMAAGRLSSDFAFCQKMPLVQFRQFVPNLATKGFTPICFRPFTQNGEVFVAAAWERTGRKWAISYGVSAAELRADNELKRNEGLWPIDIGHWQTTNASGESTDTFVAVWAEQWAEVSDSQMYVDLSEEEHNDKQEIFRQLGVSPKSILRTTNSKNENRYSAINLSLWDPVRLREEWSVDLAGYETAQSETAGWLQREVRLNGDPENADSVTYTGAWWDGGTFETREGHQQTFDEHLSATEQLTEQGFRPWVISVAAPESGEVVASVWARPLNESHKDQVAQRKANAAVALAHLDEADQLWPLLKHQKDPRLRAMLIDRLGPYKCPMDLLIERLDVETDKTIQRALIVALAEYDVASLSEAKRSSWLDKVRKLYEGEADSGIHGSCEYVLRKAGVELPELQPSSNLTDRQQGWIVDGQGNTLTVIHGPVEFQMGSLPQTRERFAEQEYLKPKKIPRSFAISTKEVTVQQYLKFEKDFNYFKSHSRELDAPINGLYWLKTAMYCRWLSEQENIPEDQMCYPPIDQILVEPNTADFIAQDPRRHLKMPEDYLSRTGYRLPTEAEWEYVCRSGTTTERYFGQTENLLSKHAWTFTNSAVDSVIRLHPVGQLRPNDYGMFDMLGNAMEYCLTRQDLESTERYRFEDTEDLADIESGVYREPRQLRGGAHLYQPSNARASHRDNFAYAYSSRTHPFIGFRVARTIPAK